MSIYIPAESDRRVQVAVEQTLGRRRARHAIRQQFAVARRIGLAHRHAAKSERNHAMVLTKETARNAAKAAARADSPAEEQHEQLVLPGTEATEQSPGNLEETHFRLADQYLQTTVRHLRKLRHLAKARDALKLIRQAQNLLMDAEDERTHEGTDPR